MVWSFCGTREISRKDGWDSKGSLETEMESDSLGADRRPSRIKGSSLVQVEEVHFATEGGLQVPVHPFYHPVRLRMITSRGPVGNV